MGGGRVFQSQLLYLTSSITASTPGVEVVTLENPDDAFRAHLGFQNFLLPQRCARQPCLANLQAGGFRPETLRPQLSSGLPFSLLSKVCHTN